MPGLRPGLCTWAGWAAFSRPQLGEQLCGPHALRQRHLRELEQIPLSFPLEETVTPAPGPPWKLALLALSSDNVLLESWIKQTCVYSNFVYTCACVCASQLRVPRGRSDARCVPQTQGAAQPRVAGRKERCGKYSQIPGS